MPRLKDKYNNEVLPKMKEEFGVKNNLAAPKLVKAVINVGAGEVKDDNAALERLVENVASFAGQKPVVTRAKKSVAGFKLVQGNPVGVMSTLRGDRMYEFLDKLFSIVLPKVRDFRGVPDTAFDNRGNFTLGLREQAIFPEISFAGAAAARTKGLELTIVTTAKNKEQGRRLLELLGMPFRKSN